MNVKVTLDKKAVKQRITEQTTDALRLMAKPILKECNFYAPQDQGTLINSSITHTEASDSPVLTLRWETPYARKMYYGKLPSGKSINFSKYPNPNACKMWAHKAQQMHGEEWRCMLQKLISGGN